jgi:hypothetical protein
VFYYETRWLSRAKLFHRVFELKEETIVFQNDINGNDDANLNYAILFRNLLVG